MTDPIVIKSDGTVCGFDFTDDVPSLEEMQTTVGGYIEPLYLPDGRVMIMDEEGVIKNKPLNPEASVIAKRGIVGDVIVMSDSLFV